MIDLRSDTVTMPTPEMRKAMAEAEVGDDVFREDPTVTALERETAELLGKEAALFVPSGTMGNELAVRLHTTSGDEIICDAACHIFNHEAGGAAALSGVTCRLMHGNRGIFTAGDMLAAIRPSDVHFSPVKAVCVENSNNSGSGSVWPVETLAELSRAAKSRGLAVHMDGARLWNASVASGVSEKQYASYCDTVSVCFSKGLGAPVGTYRAPAASIPTWRIPPPHIFRNRRPRSTSSFVPTKAVLRNNRQRMHEDHANARRLAEGLASIKGVELLGTPLETNIVRFRAKGKEAAGLVAGLKDQGVLVLATGPDSLRAVTHLQVSSADIDAALKAFASVVGK